jgi:quinol monooxygenase YgiN
MSSETTAVGHSTGSLEVELTMVTMAFQAADPTTLGAVLSQYVVISRSEPGCRNIDLCVSASDTTRFVVVEKWDSPLSQQRHFDGKAMVDMAQACNGLLTKAPDIELLEPISAHDLS